MRLAPLVGRTLIVTYGGRQFPRLPDVTRRSMVPLGFLQRGVDSWLAGLSGPQSMFHRSQETQRAEVGDRAVARVIGVAEDTDRFDIRGHGFESRPEIFAQIPSFASPDAVRGGILERDHLDSVCVRARGPATTLASVRPLVEQTAGTPGKNAPVHEDENGRCAVVKSLQGRIRPRRVAQDSPSPSELRQLSIGWNRKEERRVGSAGLRMKAHLRRVGLSNVDRVAPVADLPPWSARLCDQVPVEHKLGREQQENDHAR